MTLSAEATLTLRPGDRGYDGARAAWNLEADHRPRLIVAARSVDDVRAAVDLARHEGLGLATLATGHGTGRPCDGVLVTTAAMDAVSIDSGARRARVGAGARWSAVQAAASPYGLSGLVGSSAQVGVVGYTLGGGFGWLSRRHGFAAHAVTRAEVVLADGSVVTASATEYPDLFWSLRGSAGALGVVTELEFGLAPVRQVYGGNLYYPLDRARDVLEFFADWSRTVPDEVSASVAFRPFPPLATVPAQLRGRSFVGFRAVHCGDVAEAEQLVDQARRALGTPVADTFAVFPAAQLDRVSMDPTMPLGARNRVELIPDLDPAVIDAVIDLAGPDAHSPLAMLELRLLGGAMVGPPDALHPMAHTTARFSLNAIGVTTAPAPFAAETVRAHLDRVADRLAPLATGETYVNFLDQEQATPERVRAAFTAADWTRLVALTATYDPDHLFRYARPIR